MNTSNCITNYTHNAKQCNIIKTDVKLMTNMTTTGIIQSNSVPS